MYKMAYAQIYCSIGIFIIKKKEIHQIIFLKTVSNIKKDFKQYLRKFSYNKSICV